MIKTQKEKENAEVDVNSERRERNVPYDGGNWRRRKEWGKRRRRREWEGGSGSANWKRDLLRASSGVLVLHDRGLRGLGV